jgi:hypothetical protein
MAARCEMGIYPLILSVLLSSINYFFYICAKPENSFVLQALRAQLNNINSHFVNNLKKTLEYLDINDYSFYNAKVTLQDLQEKYESLYFDYMTSYSKLALFNKVKRYYSHAKYLDLNPSIFYLSGLQI